jgi:hypothetical protein
MISLITTLTTTFLDKYCLSLGLGLKRQANRFRGQVDGQRWGAGLVSGVLAVALAMALTGVVWGGIGASPAIAALNDDRYDGDIFALYAGNGSLVPPKVTLAQALGKQKPVLLVLYIDDSSDAKRYATVLSQLQSFYGRVTDFIFLRVDALSANSNNSPTEPSYYYRGFVPQTVLFDGDGKVVLNEAGVLPFEQVDDVFRQVFKLLPRSESITLKRRAVNEINTELAP